jgi:hypothetical protein
MSEATIAIDPAVLTAFKNELMAEFRNEIVKTVSTLRNPTGVEAKKARLERELAKAEEEHKIKLSRLNQTAQLEEDAVELGAAIQRAYEKGISAAKNDGLSVSELHGLQHHQQNRYRSIMLTPSKSEAKAAIASIGGLVGFGTAGGFALSAGVGWMMSGVAAAGGCCAGFLAGAFLYDVVQNTYGG